ncbi:MAG: class I SAM-dependent methyltransferase [Dehalococcoidia bacterium]|nr:class I SAM-dependent methyltransferase [Dehalococcoidia bacterium]
MDRLPFRLPDFTRRQWVSTRAREAWEPRLQAITQAWGEIERESVEAYVRRAALTNLRPDHLAQETEWAARRGLILLPLRQLARAAEYSASSEAPRPGQEWDYRAVYLRTDTVAEWTDAWRASDDHALGDLLGYPLCCRDAFQRIWVRDQQVDTTWAMVADPAGETVELRDIDPHNQILGRWAGYRAVPHLPCSWTCARTRLFGRLLIDLGRRRGYGQAMDWLEEALSWPYEWSALHGIAEIRSPILRIATRTDATASRYTVRIHSDHYPEAGAAGTRFPFRTRRQLHQLARTAPASRNGFTSAAAMDAAHGVLIQAAAPMVGGAGSVLDLGAGDGTLAERIGEALGAPVRVGVEVDPGRARAATGGVEVRAAGIADTDRWAEAYDLVILMPGRLEEMTEDERRRVRYALRSRTQTVLLYAYGDWLGRAGGLTPLVARTLPGAVLAGPEIARDGAAAALYTLAPV